MSVERVFPSQPNPIHPIATPTVLFYWSSACSRSAGGGSVPLVGDRRDRRGRHPPSHHLPHHSLLRRAPPRRHLQRYVVIYCTVFVLCTLYVARALRAMFSSMLAPCSSRSRALLSLMSFSFLLYVLCAAVDEKERQQGNDPERELRDTGFKEHVRR